MAAEAIFDIVPLEKKSRRLSFKGLGTNLAVLALVCVATYYGAPPKYNQLRNSYEREMKKQNLYRDIGTDLEAKTLRQVVMTALPPLDNPKEVAFDFPKEAFLEGARLGHNAVSPFLDLGMLHGLRSPLRRQFITEQAQHGVKVIDPNTVKQNQLVEGTPVETIVSFTEGTIAAKKANTMTRIAFLPVSTNTLSTPFRRAAGREVDTRELQQTVQTLIGEPKSDLSWESVKIGRPQVPDYLTNGVVATFIDNDEAVRISLNALGDLIVQRTSLVKPVDRAIFEAQIGAPIPPN